MFVILWVSIMLLLLVLATGLFWPLAFWLGVVVGIGVGYLWDIPTRPHKI